MKRFTVTLPALWFLSGESITKQDVIDADYFRIECGVLTFRRLPSRTETYPVAVRVFAPGCWAEISEGLEIGEADQGLIGVDQDHIARRMAMLDYSGVDRE